MHTALGPTPPVKRWSFSAIMDDEQCPFRTFLRRVERIPEPPRDENHPAERGNRAHKEAEDFITGESTSQTALTSKFTEELERLRERYLEGKVEVEQKWGYTKDWTPTDWGSDDCWGMVRCDIVEHSDDGRSLTIVDWKTGKRFNNELKHTQQGQIYTIGGFMRYPEARVIKTSFGYLDEGKTHSKAYDRGMLTSLLSRWEKRASRLTNRLVFPPKPSRSACRFCAYGPENGDGHCAYGVQR